MSNQDAQKLLTFLQYPATETSLEGITTETTKYKVIVWVADPATPSNKKPFKFLPKGPIELEIRQKRSLHPPQFSYDPNERELLMVYTVAGEEQSITSLSRLTAHLSVLATIPVTTRKTDVGSDTILNTKTHTVVHSVASTPDGDRLWILTPGIREWKSVQIRVASPYPYEARESLLIFPVKKFPQFNTVFYLNVRAGMWKGAYYNCSLFLDSLSPTYFHKLLQGEDLEWSRSKIELPEGLTEEDLFGYKPGCIVTKQKQGGYRLYLFWSPQDQNRGNFLCYFYVPLRNDGSVDISPDVVPKLETISGSNQNRVTTFQIVESNGRVFCFWKYHDRLWAKSALIEEDGSISWKWEDVYGRGESLLISGMTNMSCTVVPDAFCYTPKTSVEWK